MGILNQRQKDAIDKMLENEEIKDLLKSENGSFYHFFKAKYLQALEKKSNMKFYIMLDDMGKIIICDDISEEYFYLREVGEIYNDLKEEGYDFEYILDKHINGVYRMLYESLYLF